MLACEARKKLLRALPDEAPAQVRENDQAVTLSVFLFNCSYRCGNSLCGTHGGAVGFGRSLCNLTILPRPLSDRWKLLINRFHRRIINRVNLPNRFLAALHVTLEQLDQRRGKTR